MLDPSSPTSAPAKAPPLGPPSVWPLVELEWIDSIRGPDAWTPIGELAKVEQDDDLRHRSIGYLVLETETSVVLVGSFQEGADDDGERNVLGCVRIPKVAILSRRELERV